MEPSLSMTNNSWWKGLPKEIEVDLEVLSDKRDVK
jgi:hypothetical protein